MATAIQNFFRNYQPVLWGTASAFTFVIAAGYLREYQSAWNGYIKDLKFPMPPPSPEIQRKLDINEKGVREYSFLTLAAGVQAIPDRFLPTSPIPHAIVFTTKLAFMVGFFFVAIPKALGDRTLREKEIQRISGGLTNEEEE